MAQARLLLFGAVLLTLALPGHPLAPLSGLPLDLPALALLVVAAAWVIALPGVPPRAGTLAGALLALAVLKAAIGWLAPAYGVDGVYRLDGSSLRAPEAPPRGASVSHTLDFRGDTFPVHFVNDIRYLNFYTPNEPKRDLLPFTATWTGLLVVEHDGAQSLTLESNGRAALELGEGPSATVVSIDRPGRLRSATLTATLPSGLVPIRVTYTRPDEAMPWLIVRNGQAGTDGIPVGDGQLVRTGTTTAMVAREAWLRPAALAVNALIVAALGAVSLLHVWSSRGKSEATVPAGSAAIPAPQSDRSGQDGRAPRWRPLKPAERALLAVYVLVATGLELLGHLHLFDRAVILSGGNDWLAYESFARDVLLNGPLLTEGRALGQGVPFYYQPLYIYWVALTHLLLGESLFAPLVMNTVLGIATGVGLFLLTRELFGRTAAIVALPLFEAYRQTVFAQTAGLLLSENLLFPLVPVFLLILTRLAKTGRFAPAAGAGLALGLAGLTRTTPLALLPPALLILIVAWRPIPLGRSRLGGAPLGLGWSSVVTRLTLLVVVCVATIGLATARNYVVSGRPVPITSSAGANLWESHRPSSKVDLSRIEKDPLYERLNLDRATREVVEFIRQDPAGYVGTLVPMFLFAIGVIGAVENRWDVQPLLFGLWLTYLAVTLLLRQARSLPIWFLHAFIWSHLAQMTVFFSHQYGFRLILPMYVAMVPIAAAGLAVLVIRLGRLVAPLRPRLTAGAPLPPAARASLVLVATLGGATGLGAADWRGPDAAREAFYGLNGDAAIATRQAGKLDLMRRTDSTYFVGDDSRSTDVAYLSGLAFPTLRWFDGARGLVLPPAGEQALYVLPDRAAADFARRCLGDGASIGRERDPTNGTGLELMIADANASECAAPRSPIGAPLGETVEPMARLIGVDGPASIEPGRTMDALLVWEALSRPRNRARPFVRLVDSQGRRWGQGDTTVYPSSQWRPGERAVGVARIDVDPTLPPGAYRLDAGFSLGSGQARLTEDGPWGSAGLASARGADVRLVSRSTPLAATTLTLDRRLDATLDGARLIGVDFDRDAARAGERVRVTLYWERAGTAPSAGEVSVMLRRSGAAPLLERRGIPVDGTYPVSEWKPGEIVRDTWDLVIPPSLSPGPVEVAVGLAAAGQTVTQHVSAGTLAIQEGDQQLTEPDLRARTDAAFRSGVTLVGLDSKARRIRAGDTVDLTLVWRALGPIGVDHSVTMALLDEAGRIVAQQESEPAGGKRPTSGWTMDELVEDGWKFRLPRELPRGRVRLAVSLVDPIANLRVATADGSTWVILPLEVGSE